MSGIAALFTSGSSAASVEGEAADEGEVAFDLFLGGIGYRAVAIGTVLGVKLDHAPISPRRCC